MTHDLRNLNPGPVQMLAYREQKCHVGARSMRTLLTAFLSSFFAPELQTRSFATGSLVIVDRAACSTPVSSCVCCRSCAYVEQSNCELPYAGLNDSTPNSRSGTAERKAHWGKCATAGITHTSISCAVHCSVCCSKLQTSHGNVVQWDEVDQKFKVSEHASVAMKVTY